MEDERLEQVHESTCEIDSPKSQGAQAAHADIEVDL